MADATSAVLSVLGLVGTVIQVLQLGYIAADRKSDVTILRGQLHLEAVLLQRWAECVLIGPPGEVRVISTEDRMIVQERMESMLQLFKDATALVESNSKELEPLFSPIVPSGGQKDGNPPRRRHTRLFDVLSKANIKTTPLKWAVRDYARLHQLLAHIQNIRTGLDKLLSPDVHLMSLQILADVLPSTAEMGMRTVDGAAQAISENNTSDARLMDTLRATLAISRLSPDRPPTLEEATAKMHSLLITKYTLHTPTGKLPTNTGRCSVLMSSEQFANGPRAVVIEWRVFNPGSYKEVVTFEADVVKLCWLLHSLKDHPDVHLPRCQGYIRDDNFQGSTRFGILLEFPPTVRLERDSARHSQESMYNAMTNSSYRLPAVEMRLQLAMSIAASVFQLLSAGWLHKAIRSHNLLLANGLKVSGDNNQNANTPSGPIDFMLVGFEFARLDKPSEISDNALDSNKLDLYRHPKAVSENWSTNDYKALGYLKHYDMYSLGVLLAELGFWERMCDIEKKQAGKPDWRHLPFAQYLRYRVNRDMPGMMGSRFTRVVDWCLGVEAAASVNDKPLLDQFEEHVLVNLAQCRQAASILGR